MPTGRWAPVAAFLLAGSLAIGACRAEDEAKEAEATSEGGSFKRLVPASTHAGPAAPDPEIWLTPQTAPRLEAGRVVWVGTCIECHSNGLGGAPLIGNRELWAPRLAKGFDTLVEHATKGFYGDVGEMPARGGKPELTDEEIRSAVYFMASRAGNIPGVD